MQKHAHGLQGEYYKHLTFHHVSNTHKHKHHFKLCVLSVIICFYIILHIIHKKEAVISIGSDSDFLQCYEMFRYAQHDNFILLQAQRPAYRSYAFRGCWFYNSKCRMFVSIILASHKHIIIESASSCVISAISRLYRNRLRVKKVNYGRFSVNKSKIIVMALLSLFAYS